MKNVKIKNNIMTLPKTVVNKIKGNNKFSYLLFVRSKYSKLLSNAGVDRATCEQLFNKSNVYCILLSRGQLINFMQHNLNSLASKEVSDAILNNISISETNEFKIPKAFASYFGAGGFVIDGNEIWDESAISKAYAYLDEMFLNKGKHIN